MWKVETLQITINTFPEEKEQLQQIHDELADALETMRY